MSFAERWNPDKLGIHPEFRKQSWESSEVDQLELAEQSAGRKRAAQRGSWRCARKSALSLQLGNDH